MNVKPSCFSTIYTISSSTELIGLLLSLSLFHTNEKIYISCDTQTKKNIESLTPKPKLEIIWFVDLDNYGNINRTEMEKNQTWGDFQMEKANIMKKALQYETDTLFLDCDIIITDVIDDIDKTRTLGVSPHYMNKEITDAVGYYNGGVLWTNNTNVLDDWKLFTKNSRFFDQASIEDLVKKYDFFEFDDNYNLQSYRLHHNIHNDVNYISSLIKNDVVNGKLYYNKKPLKFIHTHFNRYDTETDTFNKLIIESLKKSKCIKYFS